MLDKLLTWVICLGVPVLLVSAAAIIGGRSRLKLAHRLLGSNNASRYSSKETRLFRLLILMEILIIIVLFIIVVISMLFGKSLFLSKGSVIIIGSSILILSGIGLITSFYIFRKILRKLP
jgi:hypothetical protein